MNAWTNVKVINPKHKLADQAGTTRTTTPNDAVVEVEVHFDNGTVETVKVADLQILSS